jgi:3-phenylpropionate/trans-cinnamate dioxygenase ferredoxin reductase subunit
MDKIVIAGAGQAGFQVAASLRDNGYAGRVVLVGEEPELPYQRPPLSKAYLDGKADEETLRLRPRPSSTSIASNSCPARACSASSGRPERSS